MLFVPFLLIAAVAGVSLDLCSLVNLGSSAYYSEFMTNGLCENYCLGAGYLAAITQDYNCWCANAVPADTVDLSQCNTGCPGSALLENCGGSGLYGYVVLGSVSTVGLSSTVSSTLSTQASLLAAPAPATTSSSSLTLSLALALAPSLAQPADSTSSLAPSTTSSSSSDSSSAAPALSLLLASSASQTSPSNTHTTQAPSLSTVSESHSVQSTTVTTVVTVGGAVTLLVSTKYITQTGVSLEATASAGSSSAASTSSKSFFDSAGKVAGTFTAVGVVVAAVVTTLVFCCCFRRRHDEYSDEENMYSSDDTSEAQEKTMEPFAKLRDLSQTNLKRDSSSKSIRSLLGSVAPGVVASPPVGRALLRRRPNPNLEPLGMFTISELDTRLDPAKMFENQNQLKVSLNDEKDYSRTLHITNPG